jgi:hypothetical protein
VLHVTHVEPYRLSYDHPDLRVRAVRVIGYHFVCSCGEVGKKRPTYAGARIDAGAHRAVTDDSEGVSPLD